MPSKKRPIRPVWYPAMNRWSDQTGAAHLLATRGETARPLCGARPYSLGGGFSDPADAGCRPCPRCLAIAKARVAAEKPENLMAPEIPE